MRGCGRVLGIKSDAFYCSERFLKRIIHSIVYNNMLMIANITQDWKAEGSHNLLV
jgi:hypothetical protein